MEEHRVEKMKRTMRWFICDAVVRDVFGTVISFPTRHQISSVACPLFTTTTSLIPRKRRRRQRTPHHPIHTNHRILTARSDPPRPCSIFLWVAMPHSLVFLLQPPAHEANLPIPVSLTMLGSGLAGRQCAIDGSNCGEASKLLLVQHICTYPSYASALCAEWTTIASEARSM